MCPVAHIFFLVDPAKDEHCVSSTMNICSNLFWQNAQCSGVCSLSECQRDCDKINGCVAIDHAKDCQAKKVWDTQSMHNKIRCACCVVLKMSDWDSLCRSQTQLIGWDPHPMPGACFK